jgi:hypothetical protein
MTKNVCTLVAETDYYGPATRRGVVLDDDGRPVEYDTRQEAEAAAADYDPDYDPAVDAYRLGHNQAAPTRGLVAVLVTDAFDADDWTTFEDAAPDLWEAAAMLEREGLVGAEALNRAVEEGDYVCGVGGRLYRVL